MTDQCITHKAWLMNVTLWSHSIKNKDAAQDDRAHLFICDSTFSSTPVETGITRKVTSSYASIFAGLWTFRRHPGGHAWMHAACVWNLQPRAIRATDRQLVRSKGSLQRVAIIRKLIRWHTPSRTPRVSRTLHVTCWHSPQVLTQSGPALRLCDSSPVSPATVVLLQNTAAPHAHFTDSRLSVPICT